MAHSPSPATRECADPGMLAAYYDRSLAESDRDRLEAHFADCARCQTQLAAIARADEAAPSARPRREVSWLRPLIAVPALAAAAALLLVLRSMQSSNNEFRRSDQIAMAKHQAPLTELAARAPAPASPPAAATAPSAPASSELAMNEAKPAPSVMHHMNEHRQVPERRDELRERAMPLAKELPKTEPEAMARAPSREASGDLASADAASASGRPPISAPAQNSSEGMVAAPSREAPAAATAPHAMSESAAAPRPLARSASPLAAQGGAMRMSSAAPVGGASAGAEVLVTISPQDRSTTWIVGKNGMIVRQDPDGPHPQHSGVTTDLTAGAAPSSTVCWVVGRSGTIIRTTDGEHWVLVRSPTVDNLVAVASDSANHAIVTTPSGQNFETSDGSANWHRN